MVNLWTIVTHLGLINGLISDVKDLVYQISHKQPVDWKKELLDLLNTAKALEDAGVFQIGGLPQETIDAAFDAAISEIKTLFPDKGPQ